MRMYTLDYKVGTYSGTVTVNAEEHDDNETIIARARRMLMQRSGGVPLGLNATSFVIRNP